MTPANSLQPRATTLEEALHAFDDAAKYSIVLAARAARARGGREMTARDLVHAFIQTTCTAGDSLRALGAGAQSTNLTSRFDEEDARPRLSVEVRDAILRAAWHAKTLGSSTILTGHILLAAIEHRNSADELLRATRIRRSRLRKHILDALQAMSRCGESTERPRALASTHHAAVELPAAPSTVWSLLRDPSHAHLMNPELTKVTRIPASDDRPAIERLTKLTSDGGTSEHDQEVIDQEAPWRVTLRSVPRHPTAPTQTIALKLQTTPGGTRLDRMSSIEGTSYDFAAESVWTDWLKDDAAQVMTRTQNLIDAGWQPDQD